MLRSDLSTSEYNSYYHNYILALPDVALMDELKDGKEQLLSFVGAIPNERLNYAYAVGKWTVAQVLMHIVDAERIFQYRALRFARNDKTPLVGFEQDNFVLESTADIRTKKEILNEYRTVREATISLFASFDDIVLKRMGTASGSGMSVRAMGFIICGHQTHHLKIIGERYL